MFEPVHISTDIRNVVKTEVDYKGWKIVLEKQRRTNGQWSPFETFTIRQRKHWERLASRVELAYGQRR